jgi:hypothetical protein
MQVGMADARAGDTHEHLPGAWFRLGDLLDLERLSEISQDS